MIRAILPGKKKKTVAEVVTSFQKVIIELDNIQQDNEAENTKIDVELKALKARRMVANTEINQVKTIKANFEALLNGELTQSTDVDDTKNSNNQPQKSALV
ncbi:MAG: hypothetical protein ISR90_07035 [Candidatus Marinimicrobia bacterium]|nr:hypothetical protein [Candidatus Neomarinimicrobiota bacterium]